MTKKFFIKEINDMEMVTCDTCKGTGKIIGTITSDSLNKPIENHELSCPTCNGSGKITTGKTLHYAVGTVVIYGNAHVEDAGKSEDYTLGFVCDDDSMIDKFKEANHITDFINFPNALSFYTKNIDTEMFDNYDDAMAVVLQKEKEWKPELKIVNNN